ncbi:Rieske 2Fe-2S domain-containing protein [Comamonadaceae bacterium G21597-S1]|nr:Rieske 2Fe-2S domain-containing protein [Comamonadaceae bacterium G21597-S1]
MLSQHDNELLTRTNAGTAMGDMLRRYWTPVLLSRELPEPDCPPKKLKVMGEDLLAFRDTTGRVGLVEPVCPHRGANLYYGRNEECGLRCVFHGWKFDATGQCVDMPTAPAGSRYKDRIRIKAYPTCEAGGYIWAYMGRDEHPPAMPMLAFTQVPETHRYVSKKWQDCNWLQCLEGAVDTAHFSFLHMILGTKDMDQMQAMEQLRHAALGAQVVRNDRFRWVRDDATPSFTVNEMDSGLVIGAARRADGEDLYWRITHYLLPHHALAPSAFPGENYHGQTFVPVTDTSCWIYTYTWNPDRPLTEEEIALAQGGHTVHAQVDAHYVPLRNIRNDYLIDREEQKHRSFTGITGVSEQDAAIQDSQGPIADRTREHLGATDVGIVRLRKLLLTQVNASAHGEAPSALAHPKAYCVHSGGWVAHQSRSLEDVMVERFGNAHGISFPCSAAAQEKPVSDRTN